MILVIRNRKQLWKDIKNKLNDLKEGKDITFDQLLEELDISEHTCTLAIRSSLNCPTIFLKRNPNELRINNYNSACLHAWRANMDIQFVLDVYACAMYIVSYISKAQKGMSELLCRACAEAKEGNANIKQQVRDIGNKFLNSVEMSAQEAVYLILQLPMRKSSRSVIFVNTSPPAERVELLKPLAEIEKMSDESEEIHSGGLLKRYVERPDILQNVTLADWAAWYDSCGKQNHKKPHKKADIDNLPVETGDENNDDELFNDENSVVSVSSNKTIKKRSQARIIRSVWFNKEAHPEKHYRELIMLFTPWRNEQTDLIGSFSSFQEHYLAHYDEISEQMRQYAVCSEDLNEIQQHLQECDDDLYDTIAPVTQHIELQPPTGKAAYLIKGNTIHSALAIPASQSLKNYKPLDSGRLNTLRCQLGTLKLILLDEISMVGNSMFTIQLNNRLKDLKGSKEDFGGVSIVTIGDLFQPKPVMDGYIFTDVQSLNSYNILVPNLWKKYFRMFELDEIMRQRESKMFAEVLNRLREGKHTSSDLQKLKERCVQESNCPSEAPRLFIQNALVDNYNEKVFESFSDNKYTIKAQDSVIGACSAELKEKIMRQIPYVSLRNSKQLALKLKLAVGQQTEIAINVRTDDGLTNGASNVIRLIQLNNESKPSGIVWVQFDYEDVGRKTRQENRNLYGRGIDNTWTPIKSVTTQFAVGKTKSAQVVRKQFPLRAASAKTVHRSQGDTQTQIVANQSTNRTIPHIHYVALSRVTTIEGLYITDLCEDKISVDQKSYKRNGNVKNRTLLETLFHTFVHVRSLRSENLLPQCPIST